MGLSKSPHSSNIPKIFFHMTKERLEFLKIATGLPDLLPNLSSFKTRLHFQNLGLLTKSQVSSSHPI